MPVVIAFHPDDEQGRAILNKLEETAETKPTDLVGDGTRRYHLDSADDLDALDRTLDGIDPNWREHVRRVAGPRSG
jgi:hypothetical protein